MGGHGSQEIGLCDTYQFSFRKMIPCTPLVTSYAYALSHSRFYIIQYTCIFNVYKKVCFKVWTWYKGEGIA